MRRTDQWLGKLEASGSMDKYSFFGLEMVKIWLKWVQNIKDILSIHKSSQDFI